MRIAALPILLLVFAGFVPEATSGGKVELGEEFGIKKGQEVVLQREGKLRIKFRSVKQDSRCPTGVTCVWAGNAEIEIEVSRKKARPVVALLNTALEPRQIEYSGFKIKLLALKPHPSKDVQIDPKKYKAFLIVTKK